MLEAEGAAAGSHDYKEIVGAFNSFPKEELFRASIENSKTDPAPDRAKETHRFASAWFPIRVGNK